MRSAVADSFDQHWRLDPETGCHVWLRACKGKEVATGGGYGCLSLHGRTIAAHRFAWERIHGPIPSGLQVRHQCHNTKCVNVAHMLLGTNEENQRDAALAGRRAKKLTVEDVLDIKRSCAAGVLQRIMGEKYGIAQGDVSHIVNGDWWAHVESV